MYYRKGLVREEVVTIVIISCTTCFVLGGSMGFLLAAICAMHLIRISRRREK